MKTFISYAVGIAVSAPLAFQLAASEMARADDDVTDLYFQEVIERYYENPQNARSFGMGGSITQTSRDSSNVFGNPAGLGLMQGGEASATYSRNTISGAEYPTGAEVEQNSDMGSAQLAVPIGPREQGLPEYGNFGLGWGTVDSKWDDDTFDTLAKRTQVTAAYAYGLSKDASVGYSLGWVRDKFQSRAIFDYPMSDGFRHTLGATFAADENLTMGVSAMVGHGNHHALYGPGIETDSRTFEAGFDVGATLNMEGTLVSVGADYRHLSTDGAVVSSIPQNVVGGDENGNLYNLRLGVEAPVSDMVAVRAGYRFAGLANYKYNRVELNDLNGSANYHAMSLGAGVKFAIDDPYIKSVNLDYGVEYRVVGDNDWQHVVTLGVPFNLCG